MIPKQTEFNSLLAINYKYGIDYLYSFIKNEQDQNLLEYSRVLVENLLRIHYMKREAISEEYICKILEIIKSLRDISVAKLFLELIFKSYSEQTIKKLINLFEVFDWKKLAKNIIDSMKPSTFENISNICIFIKVRQIKMSPNLSNLLRVFFLKVFTK